MDVYSANNIKGFAQKSMPLVILPVLAERV